MLRYADEARALACAAAVLVAAGVFTLGVGLLRSGTG
jgi:hypothetical protein